MQVQKATTVTAHMQRHRELTPPEAKEPPTATHPLRWQHRETLHLGLNVQPHILRQSYHSFSSGMNLHQRRPSSRRGGLFCEQIMPLDIKYFYYIKKKDYICKLIVDYED